MVVGAFVPLLVLWAIGKLQDRLIEREYQATLKHAEAVLSECMAANDEYQARFK